MENSIGFPGDGRRPPCITSMSAAPAGSAACLRFFMARRTVFEMLRDRGYASDTVEEELRRSLEDFRAEYGDKPEPERLRLLVGRATNPSRKVLVIFCGDSEMRKRDMVFTLSQISNKEMLDRVILVLQAKMNSHAQKVTEEYSVRVETFHIADLLVNITKHHLMPKHEFLTPQEKEVLLKNHSIEDKQLPMMLANDAIAKYYGLEKGQVVKMTYSGGITGTLITYRCVV